MTGRPLRFLLLILGGWTLGRVLLLWPADPVSAVLAGATRLAAAPAVMAASGVPLGPTSVAAVSRFDPKRPPTIAGWRPAPVAGVATPMQRLAAVALPTATSVPSNAGERAFAPQAAANPSAIIAPFRPAPSAPGANRLAGSAWAILRGSGEGASTGGRLGGAQAGGRLTYALGSARRVALALRVSTPLAGRGQEAAVGLDWQPTRWPLHVIAEHRVPIGPGRSGPTLSLVGGLDPLPIAAGFRLEAYGQAGVVTRAGRFVDGAVRVARPVSTIGTTRLDLGVGAWGGAQRGAARLDVGPGASLSLPLADLSVRISLDYRHRVAGGAAPGSGPVLSLGSDF